MNTEKKLEDMTFDELVDYATNRILTGFIESGGPGLRRSIWLWMQQAIVWHQAKPEAKRYVNPDVLERVAEQLGLKLVKNKMTNGWALLPAGRKQSLVVAYTKTPEEMEEVLKGYSRLPKRIRLVIVRSCPERSR